MDIFLGFLQFAQGVHGDVNSLMRETLGRLNIRGTRQSLKNPSSMR